MNKTFLLNPEEAIQLQKQSRISSAFKMTDCGNEQMKLIVGNKQFYFSVFYRKLIIKARTW